MSAVTPGARVEMSDGREQSGCDGKHSLFHQYWGEKWCFVTKSNVITAKATEERQMWKQRGENTEEVSEEEESLKLRG